jgi:DNA-binding transcriptional MocR family regulator
MIMKRIKTRNKEYRYIRISKAIEHLINKEVLQVGDKIPSIREVCREHGVSMSTALQAFYDLEAKSLIESRPQSGFYVIFSPRKYPRMPSVSQPGKASLASQPDDILQRAFDSIHKKNITLLSLGVPSDDLLPIAKLNKALLNASRQLPGSGTGYEGLEGNIKLRKQIARQAFAWEGRITEKDIITTSGCLNAISHCMLALTKPGDTVAVESPVFFGIIQLVQQLGLRLIEIPTHPSTGIEIDYLKKILNQGKIKLCLLISNFSNPLGSCMPDEHKKEAVRLLEYQNIPLIEDDMYADTYFGARRPKSCKTYDESGNVLWCGSFSKTIAPGYRVGWIAPGKYHKEILRMKTVTGLSSTSLTHEAIADILENGRYENHLRKLRQTLRTNCMQYIRAISEYFPEGTRVSHPEGGFFIWVEFDKKLNVMDLYHDALRQKISIAPGKLFTLGDQFNNCTRLSYALTWDPKLDNTLKILGRLAKENSV